MMRHLGDPISRRLERPLGWHLSRNAYASKILSYSPIAYWPLWETGGSTAVCLVNSAQNGTYVGTTIGQTVTDANGVSFVCPLFDGINDYVNIYSAALNTAHDPNTLTVAMWGRVSGAGLWTDSTTRRIAGLRADFDNQHMMERTATNNQIRVWTRYGATSKFVADTSLAATLNWFHLAYTLDKTGDALKFYINGSQIGATQTGLGVWAGNLSATDCCIGAKNTAAQEAWYGWLSHCVLFDTVLTQPQIADLATA